MPLLKVLSFHRGETLIAIGLKVTEVAWVNVLSVFAVAYLTKQLGMMPALAAPLAGAKVALQKEVDAWRSRETEQDRARSGRFE